LLDEINEKEHVVYIGLLFSFSADKSSANKK